jgi:transcriptional regulator with XRE-family HTH domain
MNKPIKTDIGLSVGKSIRNLRELKGWKQEIIAKRLNISIPAFSKIETGFTDVNLSRLEQIALIFELNVANLLSDEPKQTPISRADINIMLKKLAETDSEIVLLQRKIIRLYDKIHRND